MMMSETTLSAVAGSEMVAACADQLAHAREKFAGVVLQAESEEVANLGAGNQHRNAVGETHHDRAGNELHRFAKAGEAHDDQHHACHHGAEEQSLHAVLDDDSVDDHDEGAGGAADLRARAAQQRDEESGDDRAVDAGLRSHSAGDGKGHGERQRN